MVFHGNVSPEIANGLKVLRQRIKQSDIPPMKIDETLNIATWNIRAFGKSARSEEAIHYIAEIIWQFGLVAIVELSDNLGDLKRVMGYLGPNWEATFSDFNTDYPGNRERMGYLYDTRMVTPLGLASEADPPRTKDPVTKEYVPKITFWRSPYMVTFRCGNFDFMLMTAHVRWDKKTKGSRLRELQAMAEWIEKRTKDRHVEDKDIIVMGDFNIPDRKGEMFAAITKYGLQVPLALKDVKGTNLGQVSHYDQILHARKYKTSPSKGGVLDFAAGGLDPLFPKPKFANVDLTYQMSDHLPLWVQLDTWVVDAQLEQLIQRPKKRKPTKENGPG